MAMDSARVIRFLSVTLIAFNSLSFSQDHELRAPVRLNITGVWHSPGYGLMVLQHKGRRITGTYEHDNGQLDGILEGDRITFKWWEQVDEGKPYDMAKPDHRGQGYFTVSPDSRTFSGMWKYEGSAGWNGAWSAVKGEDVTGTWESLEWGRVKLLQEGLVIKGTYEHDGGQLEGKIEGWRIVFRWWEKVPVGKTYDDAEPTARGEAYFDVVENGKKITGQWRFEGSGSWDGNWSAVRK
jgi:hypothetical protein